jgi:hypothetical protein
MPNDIGSVKSIDGTSMALNGQKGYGGEKPNMGKGKDSPGGTKPEKPDCAPVAMPK